jgi:hypothetical protein
MWLTDNGIVSITQHRYRGENLSYMMQRPTTEQGVLNIAELQPFSRAAALATNHRSASQSPYSSHIFVVKDSEYWLIAIKTTEYRLILKTRRCASNFSRR